MSLSPDRSDPVPLAGQVVSGNIYVFTSPDTDVKSVSFYVDDPDRTGDPFHIAARRAPFDLAGKNRDGTAKPFDADALADGEHTVTASIELSNGSFEVIHASFTRATTLDFTPGTVNFAVEPDGSAIASVDVAASDGGAPLFDLTDDADWLEASPISGQAPATVTLTVDATGVAPGTYLAAVTATDPGGQYLPGVLNVELTISGGYTLMLSLAPDRSNSEPLAGQTVSGPIYVFTTPDAGVSRVDFFLDNPTASGKPLRRETLAPFDFAGTASDGSANPFDPTTLTDGDHVITALITSDAGEVVVDGIFRVGSPLVFTPSSLTFDLEPGESDSAVVALDTADSSTVDFDIGDDANWLTVTPTSGQTPASITVTADSTGLAEGAYSAIVSAAAAGLAPASLGVSLTVGNPGCEPVACEDIMVELPYQLDFTADAGFIVDGAGVGTGFTYIDPPSNGTGYLPPNLAVDLASGVLEVTTTSGLALGASNSLDNALGVGVDAPSQVTLISTTLTGLPVGSGSFEQAGLWFGNDEDNYVKLVVLETNSGHQIQVLLEAGGTTSKARTLTGLQLTGSTVGFQLRTDPGNQSVGAYYSIDGAPLTLLDTFTVPAEFFSFDGAGNDPRIGTRSFTGIFASHRNGPGPITYTFADFSVEAEGGSGGGSGSTLSDFTRVSFPVNSPTSMVWGPDNRLYVTELFGRIHALTLDENKQVVSDQVIETLRNAHGPRLTLGIAVDPDSTSSNVILWVSHSSGSVDNGAANSSTITKLSGTGFTTMEDVITGLPRAIANHAVNSLHFGPDGRLYIAMGGNTGTGAPNDQLSEFGTRPEQPLSAALIVADVKASGFEGDCASAVDDGTGTADKTIPATCDVTTYATGLRNMYDFTFHSNGSIYGPDNGLGVKGTVPASPTPDCQGIVAYGNGELDPGAQPDPLLRIEEGAYYGHPNPARDECVFKDGTFQGVAPLPDYTPPIHNLGDHKSANGVIEYTSARRCGKFQGNLFIANFSTGDDITRVVLSSDGSSVVSATSLEGGFTNPLPLATGPDGTVYVGELNGNRITALVPADLGCWETRQPSPTKLLDVGGAALGGKLYVVAGKSSNGPQSTTYVYDPVADSWSAAADLPGPAVENPAVVAGSDGKLYAFGGSTEPFSGAVANASAYNPATNTWSALAPMPTARGGATAQEIGGLIYVVGGMAGDSSSLNVVEIYNPATNTWTTGPSMMVRRDNPGSAVLGGNLYVFGGRTRDATGEVDGTLNSVEMFDPATGTWSLRAPMPTGRRTFVVGTLNGRAQVMGGEKTPTNETFPQNEEYDPLTDTWRTLEPMLTPRHGAAAGTIDGVVYVATGGPQAGTSFSDAVEAFAFEGS